MRVDKFRSVLGDVAVSEDHIERVRSDSDDWERLDENFSEEKLVDSCSFERIDDIELDRGSVFPCIRLKIDGDWKMMFFQVADEVEKCFKRLNYRWRAYQEVK